MRWEPELGPRTGPPKAPLAMQPDEPWGGFWRSHPYKDGSSTKLGAQPCPWSKNHPAQGYPARPPQHSGCRVGQARGPNTTQLRGAMEPRLTSAQRLDVKWGPTMSPPINPRDTQRSASANDRSPQATTHLERPPTGYFWVSLIASPLFQSAAPG